MIKTIATFVMLGIAGGVFFMYTKPTYDAVQGVKAEVAQFDAALDKARELQELKRQLLARFNTFSTEQLNRLSHLLPDHVDNVRLVLDLDSIASRYGMAIQNVVIDRPDAGKTETVIGALTNQGNLYESLTMQFSLRGTYGSFTMFLRDLESSLRLVDMVALTIQQEAPEEGVARAEPVYRFNMTVRTYWLK